MYTKLLSEDTGLQLEGLPKAMEDRHVEGKSQFSLGNPPDTMMIEVRILKQTFTQLCYIDTGIYWVDHKVQNYFFFF